MSLKKRLDKLEPMKTKVNMIVTIGEGDENAPPVSVRRISKEEFERLKREKDNQ